MTFLELYNENFAFVWRSLKRLRVPEADVADASQEVFLVVAKKLHEFEGRAKVTTWLFRICLCVASDRRKRAHRHHEVSDDQSVLQSIDTREAAPEALERHQDLVLFDAALDRMDMDQRAVFCLFELEGMTGDQIAETLELPLGTVYSRLRSSRETFSKAVRTICGTPRQADGRML